MARRVSACCVVPPVETRDEDLLAGVARTELGRRRRDEALRSRDDLDGLGTHVGITMSSSRISSGFGSIISE